MTGFIAIARREVREHRVVLAAAAVASLGALAVPLLHVGTSGAEVRGVTAFLGALVFAAGIAVGLGATTLAPGMATRRIGFDFARPLSASAIWGGRLTGAMLLGGGAALILWIPAAIAGARPPWNDLWTAPERPAAWPLWALAGFAVLFAIAHCASLALRSRSGLLALDAVLAVLCAFLVWAAFSRLPIYRAEAPSLRLGVGLAVAIGAACLAAGYTLGRSRPNRCAHRAPRSLGRALDDDRRRRPRRQRLCGVGPWREALGPARRLLGDSRRERALGDRVGARARRRSDIRLRRGDRALRTRVHPRLARAGPLAGRQARRLGRGAVAGSVPVWIWRLDVAGEKAVRTRIFLAKLSVPLRPLGGRRRAWRSGKTGP